MALTSLIFLMAANSITDQHILEAGIVDDYPDMASCQHDDTVYGEMYPEIHFFCVDYETLVALRNGELMP